jgi:hypothetical protein
VPLSNDPDKRARQLANLTPGGGYQFKPGNTAQLTHGLRSRLVQDDAVQDVRRALALDAPVRAPDGGLPAADEYMVELAAIALVRLRRCAYYLAAHGDRDEHGRLRPESVEFDRHTERCAKLLDRLGLSPRARAALGLDLARAATAQDSLNAHLRTTYEVNGDAA